MATGRTVDEMGADAAHAAEIGLWITAGAACYEAFRIMQVGNRRQWKELSFAEMQSWIAAGKTAVAVHRKATGG